MDQLNKVLLSGARLLPACNQNKTFYEFVSIISVNEKRNCVTSLVQSAQVHAANKRKQTKKFKMLSSIQAASSTMRMKYLEISLNAPI